MRFYKPQKGASLPTLTKAATAQDIVSDKEAINGAGEKIVGKLDTGIVYTQNGEHVFPLFYEDEDDLTNPQRCLKLLGSLGNATAADIRKGKQTFTDNGFVTGTLEVTGGEPSHTFQIRTENASDGTDSIIYYEPGSTEKKTLNLTTSYQTITCGNFICINRGSSNNILPYIRLYDDYLAVLFAIGATSKYVVDNKPNGGFCTVNIGAIVKEYSTMTKIELAYSG